MRSRPLALAVVVVLGYQAVIGVAQYVDARQGATRPHEGAPSVWSPADTEITYVHGYQPSATEADMVPSGAGDARRVVRTVAPAVWETPAAFSLPAAAEMADLIVVGTARAVQFRADGDTLVTFAVERSLKGAADEAVVIAVAGGLRPAADGRGAPALTDSADVPLLLPGERAVLFLRPDRCIAAACIAQLAPELSARLANTLALVDGAEGGDSNAAPTRPVRHVAQPAAEPAGPVG